MRKKKSTNASKRAESDYERTKEDFYRMDLHKMQVVESVLLSRSFLLVTIFLLHLGLSPAAAENVF